MAKKQTARTSAPGPTDSPAKKAAKKPPRSGASAPPGFADLTTWKRVPLDEAEDHDFLAATNDSVDYEDCFGDEPGHVMVHEGPVTVAGAVALDGWKAPRAAQQTVHIIVGDLTVDGALVFDQSDIMTVLWVTGDVTAKRLACLSTAMLIVGGALTVAEILVTDLEDAGHLIVHGPTVAATWIDLAQGRGCIELAGAPRTRFLSDHYAELAASRAGEAEPGDDAPGEGEAEPGDDEPEAGEAHRPRSFPCAPASPELDPKLLAGDRSISRKKLLDALREGAPILR